MPSFRKAPVLGISHAFMRKINFQNRLDSKCISSSSKRLSKREIRFSKDGSKQQALARILTL
jgi:hypothetical protein